MGSITLGRASAFGPDFTKAKLAAAHVFSIIDNKSEIDSSNMDGLSVVTN